MKISVEVSLRKLLALALMLVVLGGAVAVAVFTLTQTATYTKGTAPLVLTSLDFEVLYDSTAGSKTFTSAINVGSASGTVTIRPSGPWISVFTIIILTVKAEPNVKATNTVFTNSFSFTIGSGETVYDYVFDYTTVSSLPATPPLMQLTVDIG